MPRSTTRCRSWRYAATAGSGHADHLPGACRACWRPCRSKLSAEERAAGATRCDACAESLRYCPNPEVRRALVDEPDQAEWVLRALANDPVGSIALAAGVVLEARFPAQPAPQAARPLPHAADRQPLPLPIGPRR